MNSMRSIRLWRGIPVKTVLMLVCICCLSRQACGQARVTIEAGDYTIKSLAFSPDGRTLASADESSVISLWDSQTGQLRKSIDQFGTRSVIFSPDGRTLAVGGRGAVSLLDPHTGRLIQTLKPNLKLSRILSDPHRVVAFSPDGRHLVVSPNAPVLIWDTQTRKFKSTGVYAESVCLSKDGAILAVGESGGGKISLIDTGSGRKLGTI